MEEQGQKLYPSDLTDKQCEEIAPLYILCGTVHGASRN